jgi:hypothetical protein
MNRSLDLTAHHEATKRTKIHVVRQAHHERPLILSLPKDVSFVPS